MYFTRMTVELPIATRLQVIAILNRIADLKAQVKSACWNVITSNCIELQEFAEMAN